MRYPGSAQQHKPHDRDSVQNHVRTSDLNRTLNDLITYVRFRFFQFCRDNAPCTMGASVVNPFNAQHASSQVVAPATWLALPRLQTEACLLEVGRDKRATRQPGKNIHSFLAH